MDVVTSQAGYRGLQEAIALCTASVAEDHSLLLAHLEGLHNRIFTSEDSFFFFCELATSFLAIITSFVEALGCVDEEEKLTVFQALALTTESHFQKEDKWRRS